jgi:hypothetical protein
MKIWQTTITLLLLVLMSSIARADACDEANQLFDEILPKVSTGLDQAGQATNLDELIAALNQVADALDLIKTRLTSRIGYMAEVQKLTPPGSQPESWPKNCLRAFRRGDLLQAEVEAAGTKLEKYFAEYSNDPALTAVNERIKKALSGGN